MNTVSGVQNNIEEEKMLQFLNSDFFIMIIGIFNVKD